MGKYFNVEVNPTIAASVQATQFDSGDIVYDWTPFDVPKGANKLIGITTLVRGTNGAKQEFIQEILFAKSINGADPSSLGTVNASADASLNTYANQLIGYARVHTNDYENNGLDYMSISTTSTDTESSPSMTTVLQGEPQSGVNVGFDKLYIACTSQTSSKPDFQTNVFTTGAVADNQKVVGSLDDGSGGSAGITSKFAVGDIIHNVNDELVGTIASIDSAIQFTTVDNVSVAQVENDRLFVLNPIKVILHFER